MWSAQSVRKMCNCLFDRCCGNVSYVLATVNVDRTAVPSSPFGVGVECFIPFPQAYLIGLSKTRMASRAT